MTEQKYLTRSKTANSYRSSAPIVQVAVDRILSNPSQPRSDFDNDSIIRLADSIRRYGMIQPIAVRRLDSGSAHTYELIAGERRLRAARMLGYYTVPCVVVEADEKTSAEMAIIENLLRKDLNMFEQARGFKNLVDNYGMTQEEVARKMSLSQSAVANKIRLLRLTESEQRLLIEYKLSERHARALLRLETPDLRAEVLETVIVKSLNVENTEKLIDEVAEAISADASKTDARAKNRSLARDTESFVSSVQRKIASFKKYGKDASLDVVDTPQFVELHIKMAK